MRRAVAVAMLAGLGAGGWLLWRRGGFGPPPDSTADLGALAGYRPSELQRELDTLDYARTAGAILAERGLSAEGPAAAADASPLERRALAEAECRRGSSAYGMPAYEIPACVAGLEAAPFWHYRNPDARVAVTVHLGYGGLGTAPAADHVARLGAGGRPIPPA